MKDKNSELELKIQLKRLGGEGFKAENRELNQQVEGQLARLDPGNKTDKKKIDALNRDKAALEQRIAKIDAVLKTINGQLTDDEAKYSSSRSSTTSPAPNSNATSMQRNLVWYLALRTCGTNTR